MCRSKAEGGKRCLDVQRYQQLGIEHFAPEVREGVPPVAWVSGAGGKEALESTWAHGQAPACWSLTLLEEIRAEEPAVTADVMAVAAASGGRCEGLAFRMKSPESLARKLHDEFQTLGPAEDLEAVARSEADDAIRYTICVADSRPLTGALESAIAGLRDRGWEPLEVKDSYLDANSYKGLHIIARTPAGRTVEVQVHSDSSLRIKEEIHGAYETARSRDAPLSSKVAAIGACVEASSVLATPAGLDRYYATEHPDRAAVGSVLGVKIRKKAYSADEKGGA